MTAPADPPATVLFDWNGTLLDDMERARLASSLVREQFAGLGELTLNEFREAWCLPLSDHARRLGVPDDRNEDATRAWSTHFSTTDAPLAPGVPGALEALRSAGIAVSVVSSASDDAVRRDIKAHGLEQHFDNIHTGVQEKKTVISRYVENASTGAVWYVGDSMFDMVQACAAGAVAVGFTAGYDAAGTLRDAGAHHLIDGMDDLISLISQPWRPSG